MAGSSLALQLRLLPGNFESIAVSQEFSEVPCAAFQLARARQLLHFLDCKTYYHPAEQEALLRGLQLNEPVARQLFYRRGLYSHGLYSYGL